MKEEEKEGGGGGRRRWRGILGKSASIHTRPEEAPRLRGHSKFSGLFRQCRESPSKLMLPGHAISGRSNCSIFLAYLLSALPLSLSLFLSLTLQLPKDGGETYLLYLP